MQQRPQLGGRGRVHPRSTVLQMGARWILKRGGVDYYPEAYQEQGKGAQEDKKQRTSERRMKLLAR